MLAAQFLKGAEPQKPHVRRPGGNGPGNRLHRVAAVEELRAAEEFVRILSEGRNLSHRDLIARKAPGHVGRKSCALEFGKRSCISLAENDRRPFIVVGVSQARRHAGRKRPRAEGRKAPRRPGAAHEDVDFARLHGLLEISNRVVRHRHVLNSEGIKERREGCRIKFIPLLGQCKGADTHADLLLRRSLKAGAFLSLGKPGERRKEKACEKERKNGLMHEKNAGGSMSWSLPNVFRETLQKL